ncbi:MAG: hypothetical protein JXB15_03655 [Anaerolineales bacterium]|nr:hypothetical protein [Anaerolineales bacterium]
MLHKTFLVIIISSLLLLAVGITPAHIIINPFFIPTPPPPSGEPPEPPDGIPVSPPGRDSPSGDDDWLQTILDSLQGAWEDIVGWLNGAVDDLQHSIADAISQFLQGLIDQIVQQATQTLQELLNQTCGLALLLPLGTFAGVWLISRRR